MTISSLQQSLFRKVKEQLPAHISLADELAGLLSISADSAYRRIRGEKPVDIEELHTICRHFRISFDALSGGHSGDVIFSGALVNDADFSFADWLSSLSDQLQRAAQGSNCRFIFQSKDIPLFHHFQWPELSAFKFFFWRRTILQQTGPELEKLDLHDGSAQLLALGRKVFLSYLRMPSIEIWNSESLNSTLRQINYYRETGVLQKEEDAQLLFDQCLHLLGHLESQAEAGLKFQSGTPSEQGAAAYELYRNEVLLGDNAIYSDNGRTRVVFLNHTGLNYLATTDARFVDYTHRSLVNIIKRSTLISGSGEKERRRFFRDLRDEVERRRR